MESSSGSEQGLQPNGSHNYPTSPVEIDWDDVLSDQGTDDSHLGGGDNPNSDYYEDRASPSGWWFGPPREEIKPITFSPEPINPQWESPLFSLLPSEIRTLILEYALKDYEDKTKVYDDATCYKRPGYLAPRRTDTEVLRTCKRIYNEAWYMPFASAEHSFYIAWEHRSPPMVTTVGEMQRALNVLHASHVEPDIEHVRVFAQLCQLESGTNLTEILNMGYFHPKVLTITIRHTDWWEWEGDAPLHCGEEWVNACKFPESVKELNVAFESLERKKASVDQVAEQAIKKWEFERKDGVIMSAEGCQPSIMRWSGSSTWESRRWLRDETRPRTLDYYVATVTWSPVVKPPVSVLPDGVDTEAPKPRRRKVARPLDAEGTSRLLSRMASVSVPYIEAAGVPHNAPTDEVQRLVREFMEREHQRHAESWRLTTLALNHAWSG